jgi:AcrR family transcriptional regulator
VSPRPRARSDADILAAAVQVIGQVGPGKLTLADVAREVGLSPPTLVQRFGSKRGLLLAVARGAGPGLDFAAARARHRSAVDALVRVLADCTRYFGSPENISNHLAFLEIDLTDPEFHQIALDHARRFRAELRAVLDQAVREGELRPGDTTRLARVIEATYHGSLLAWAIHREGSVEKWVQQDLETLLAPFRTRVPPSRRRPKKSRAPQRRRA